MASSAAPQHVYEGCITCADTEKRRRPYHKNCKCALHQKRCLPQDVPCNTRISYPMTKSWSTTSLSSMNTSSSGVDTSIRRSGSGSSLNGLENAGLKPIGRSWSGTSLHSLSKMPSFELSELREDEDLFDY